MAIYQEIPGKVFPESRTIVAVTETGEVAIRSLTDVIYEMAGFRGEQPDSPIHSDAGALSVDVPRSKAERSEA